MKPEILCYSRIRSSLCVGRFIYSFYRPVCFQRPHKCTHFSPLLRQIHLSDPAQTEPWTPPQSHRDKFYQVPITEDKVHFVDSVEALQTCQHAVLKVHKSKSWNS